MPEKAGAISLDRREREREREKKTIEIKDGKKKKIEK